MGQTDTKVGQGRQVDLKLLLLRLRTLIALVVIVAVFGLISPNFLTIPTILIMTRHIAINAFIAIGMTLVIVSGGIDLSVGSILGLCGMIAGYLINVGVPVFGHVIYFRIWFVIVVAVVAGGLIGAINGLVITRLRVAPFIATLGMMHVARGLSLLSNNGATFPFLNGRAELGNTGFPFLGEGDILGVPVPIWLLVIVAVIMVFVVRRTPFGRYIYAAGGNERAARLSGVRVDRMRVYVYVLAGVLAAVSGLIVTSQLNAAHPSSGETYEMNAIAAAVLGGTSLMGGRGTIGGTIIGAFVIGALSEGLVMMGVSNFWQMVIKGVVIVVAVAIDQLQLNASRVAAVRREKGVMLGGNT